MKRILIGKNVIEMEIDGRIELRFFVKNEEEKMAKFNALKASHMSAKVVNKEDIEVRMSEFEQENDFDWTQSLILLSE